MLSPSSACQIIRSWRNAKKKTDISSRVLDSTHANVPTLSERNPNPLGGGRLKGSEPIASRNRDAEKSPREVSDFLGHKSGSSLTQSTV